MKHIQSTKNQRWSHRKHIKLRSTLNVASDRAYFFCSHNTRCHRLSVQRSRLDLRKNFFSPQVVKIGNILPQDVNSPHCQDVQEKIGHVLRGMDMSVKGVAYQAHYHLIQSQIQDIYISRSRNLSKFDILRVKGQSTCSCGWCTSLFNVSAPWWA